MTKKKRVRAKHHRQFPTRKLKRSDGSVYERCEKFYVRYYTRVDGHSKQVSALLCAKDAGHPTPDCDAVLDLRDDYMRQVRKNGAPSGHSVQAGSIVEFWKTTFLPHVEKNTKPSTATGYQQIFNQHLRDHLADKTFTTYRAHMGTALLTEIAPTCSRNTISHVRALLSNIFKFAVATGVIEHNPIRDVKLLVKCKPSQPTGFYSLEEAEDIISALVDHVECQLVIALSCFLGLRPGEIRCLKIEDFDDHSVHIRRSVWRGIVGTPKTPESVASIPLIDAVRVPLKLWLQKRGNPTEGWLFETVNGTPVELRDWIRNRIMPTLAAEKIAWKGLYAGRRGAATAAIDLTGGNITAGQEILRHKSAVTTMQFYKKATGVNLKAGLAAISNQLALKGSTE